MKGAEAVSPFTSSTEAPVEPIVSCPALTALAAEPSDTANPWLAGGGLVGGGFVVGGFVVGGCVVGGWLAAVLVALQPLRRKTKAAKLARRTIR
jgi:hypothetical protein